ncbi:hypothetical protein [Thalassovita taeanensis]|uniref:hypothetical protein n=1 Tax=Thalassovita taeanensis TaxID=657014 RepID=UPI001587DCFA|nr:hypothetical protein [Thalassovita taeanensis]
MALAPVGWLLRACGTRAERVKWIRGATGYAVYSGLDVPLADGIEIVETAIQQVFKSDDDAEGLAGIAEKRPPNFND